VPADPSSPILAALAHLTHCDPRQLPDADAPHLLAYLAADPSPRAARGRRHPLVAILAMAAAAVLAGAPLDRLPVRGRGRRAVKHGRHAGASLLGRAFQITSQRCPSGSRK
jgi:hypothetical protein